MPAKKVVYGDTLPASLDRPCLRWPGFRAARKHFLLQEAGATSPLLRLCRDQSSPGGAGSRWRRTSKGETEPALPQLVCDADLAESRLLDGNCHDGVFDLLCDAVFQHWLRAADLLQHQLAAFGGVETWLHYQTGQRLYQATLGAGRASLLRVVGKRKGALHDWVVALLARRPARLVTVASANKLLPGSHGRS